MVNYVVTATDNLDTSVDNLDTSVDISCSPTSGTVFTIDILNPIVTTVNCSATDDVGNQSSDSFDVTTEFEYPCFDIPAKRLQQSSQH